MRSEPDSLNEIPSKRISPLSVPFGVISRFKSLRSVDFPLPVAPQSTVKSPDFSENDRPFTAGRSQSGYVKFRFLTVSISI